MVVESTVEAEVIVLGTTGTYLIVEFGARLLGLPSFQ